MINKIRDIYYDELEHVHRYMLSLILSEIIILVILRSWPAYVEPPRSFDDPFTDEVIFVEKAIVTRQITAPAAPPKPRIPVPVPNDEIIIEEIDFPEFDEIMSKFEAEGTSGFSEAEGEGKFVGSPEQRAGLIRIVEPTVPEAAKRAKIKARITVTFLVGTKGEVEEVNISEMRLYDGDEYEKVQEIGYGLMEAVLVAARKWKFRPAKDQGVPVKTFVENSFNIGF